jgi:TetR/AcrR family transcriptional regulator, repressor for uid operon
MSQLPKDTTAPDHSEERHSQILRAAMACFARRGFHHTTMNDISAEADISVGLIYRYFESKDAIINYMASEHLADLRLMLEDARMAPTLFTALEIIAFRHCEEQPEHLHASVIADLFAEAARNEHVRALVRDVTEFLIEGVADLIAASDEAATAPPGLDPRQAAEIIIDATRGLMIRAIADASTLTAPQVRERQLAMLRTLWPLLFSRNAPAAYVEPSQP